MASNESHPPPRSWKPEIEPDEAKRGAGPMWRRDRAIPVVGVRTRRSRLVLGGVAFLCCTAVLIWVSFWLWPVQRASLLLIGAGYETNLVVPPNVYGWQSLQDLARVVGDGELSSFWGSGLLRLHQAPRELKTGEPWDRDLDQVREKTIIVYLALQGAADAQGAYLLPADANAQDRPENRLRLEAVIRRLGQLPASKRKVLVVDSIYFLADWQLGVLQNDFARALEKLDPLIAEVPNLVVLSAAAPDQRAWSSPEWRRTAFGHFFIEGLRGAAGDENNDNRTSLYDLYLYLETNVPNWVWANRQAWQTPVLFPKGDAGVQRARQVDLAFVQPYQPPDPAKTPAFQAPPELVDAWKTHRRLLDEVPSPEVYAPQLWRQYQDTLLRHDFLVRAGSRAAAGRMASQLNDLEQELGRLKRLTLTSAGNSLPMPAAAGLMLPPDPIVRKQLDDLWNAAPEDAAKKWAQMLAAAPDPLRLRWQAYAVLLDRAIDDPSANLEKVARYLRVVADPVNPRPIEAQFALLLQRDLARSGPPPDLLQLALRISGQAERTALAWAPGVYPYSGQVYPWTQADVARADQQRRLGQDLLFASTPEDWEKSRGFLLQAQEAYSRAQDTADAVRNALALRDRILSRLPYFSRWIVNHRLVNESQLANEAGEQFQSLLDLWRLTHQLERLLEKPDLAIVHQAPPPSADNPKPLSLAQQTAEVHKAFTTLEQQFGLYTLGLNDIELQLVLRHIENVLLVPYVDPDLRIKLETNLSAGARQLLIQTTQQAGKLPPLDLPTRYRDWYKPHARSEGQMALAVLGRDWFNQCAGPGGENFGQAQHRLDTFLVEERWWESLGKVATQVGKGWQQIPVEIGVQVKVMHTARYDDALAALQKADLLARRVDGAGSLLLDSNPADLYRRLCMKGLLLVQARRELDDHWFADDPSADPYYRTAGLLYWDDSRRLDPRPEVQGGLEWEQVQTLQQKLKGPGRLSFAGPARQNVTTNQQFALAYQLGPVEGAWVPPGNPVVWFNPGGNLDVFGPAGQGRQVRTLGTDGKDAKLTCPLISPLLNQAEADPPAVPSPVPTTLTIRGLYRGQVIELATRVNLYPLPDLAVQNPPLPQAGSVAVRAAPDAVSRFGASNGHIAIVLDCSGSMGPPGNQPYGPTTKYNEALAALRAVLQKLPKGATVSLWVFGQALGAGKTVEEAEKTVRRIQDPVAWDPDSPAQLKALMTKVEYPALEPWNETPLVRTMVKAKEDLKNVTGFKSLVVITDGMDNRFDKDKELNPKKQDIPTFLVETFRDSGIVINMIGYKVVSKEEKAAEEQFKVIESLPLPGRFVTVNDAKELGGILERALRQKLFYWVDSEDNVPVRPGTGTAKKSTGVPGLDVSPIGTNDQWFPGGLPSAAYKLRVHTDRRLVKNIAIKPGDLLLVDLVKSESGIGFERGLFSKSEYPWKPSQTQSGWRFAVLQNQAVGQGGLQMLATLEKEFDPREDTLEMLRPRTTWIEVKPSQDSTEPYAVRRTYRTGYPAAAWGIDVPRWPAGRPIVKVWWNPDQEFVPATSLDRGADFRALAELPGQTILVDGDEARIDSAGVEEHLIEVRPGQREKRSCLVVRLTHTPGKPIWILPKGIKPGGMEQRFYTQVGQSTALFWPVTKEEADQSLGGLGFYSISSFQRNAEKRGFMLEMKDLKLPEPSDVRPRPAVELKVEPRAVELK